MLITDGLYVSFLPQRGGKLLGCNGNGASHELGDIVALEHLQMTVGVVAGELERLGAAAISIDMSDERTGEDAIMTARREDDPAAVG